MRLPPLRDRREDLGMLVASLLTRITAPHARNATFSTEVGRSFLRYGWPLNVRELEKCLASSIVLAGSSRVELEHLPG